MMSKKARPFVFRPHYREKFVFIIKISLVNGCSGSGASRELVISSWRG